LLIDEAHASGSFGRGIARRLGLEGDIDIVMGTFSKALGSFGAYAACSETMKQYLINSARGFIYSTSLPASIIAASIAALKIVSEQPELSGDLQNKSSYFRNRLRASKWDASGESQIIPVLIGESEKAMELASRLHDAGIRALAIRPPTVPRGSARLRFSLSVAHSIQDLDYTIEVMDELRHVTTQLSQYQ
jgi:7-keto-8-aminopelargonate synthetase-like enzyme